MNRYLIAGLGNIGDEYRNTRHNIGFKIAEACAKKWNATPFQASRYASAAQCSLKGRKIILIKPATYMNESGKAIRYWLTESNTELNNLLVVLDDLALPFGAIRIRAGGSDGGHNGLKSISETIQSGEYARLRFGIANNFPKGKQVDYVLGEWTKEEETKLDEYIGNAVSAIEAFCLIGIDRAMTLHNTRK
ncbi:MAG: aminoacyl-tRNA hydrolase [Bacteroidia bacterium]|jgi:PTH1 family peptidyl-tRNA hydrolase|nr:aminoacyl-tRNA hydrolase [Bacteroidia bacterium]